MLISREVNIIKYTIISTVFLFYSFILNSQSIYYKAIKSDSVWTKLSPFFSPPAGYKENYGNYRSPLKFYNGEEVKNSSDWKKRRKEILSTWNGMMGQWPPFIEHQKMEIIEKVKIGNYMRYKISYNWLPGQRTEAYLLIPDGKGKKPAVITV
jgi:hypothetical protein